MQATTATTYVLTPVLIAAALNAYIFSSGLNAPTQPRNPLLPPGWVIGTIWIIQFALLGYTLYLVNNQLLPTIAICVVILYCLAYPFLSGLEQGRMAYHLNSGALVLAMLLTGGLMATQKENATAYTVPLLLWAMFVNWTDTQAST